MIREFITKIKRKENRFYSFLYDCGKTARQFSVPTIHPIHSILYHEWAARTNLWHNFWRVMYYEPMFRSQCRNVGKGFRMEYAGNGTTRIQGDLQMIFGSNVTIFDNTMLAGLTNSDKPELHIGDNSWIGPAVHIYVGKKISIGKSCKIGSFLVADNYGHPVFDIMARMAPGGGRPEPDSIRPVSIGDFCWLGYQSVVYPGITIGDGALVTIGTHVSRDVPPFCVVSGNPMRIRMKYKIPPEIKALVGEERYLGYLEIHSKIKVHK